MVTYLTLDKKGRTTLPEEIREDLGVGPGDLVLLERTERGTFELVPAELVPRDQLWFQHPEMQARIHVAEEDIQSGRTQRVSGEEFLERLESWTQEKRGGRRRRA